jgi:hypothetical protein
VRHFGCALSAIALCRLVGRSLHVPPAWAAELVFVHGGGYQKGDRKEGEALGRVFAARGVGVAVISHRLFPAVKHPEHVCDVARAFAWVKGNAAKHGGRLRNADEYGYVRGDFLPPAGHLRVSVAPEKATVESARSCRPRRRHSRRTAAWPARSHSGRYRERPRRGVTSWVRVRRRRTSRPASRP